MKGIRVAVVLLIAVVLSGYWWWQGRGEQQAWVARVGGTPVTLARYREELEYRRGGAGVAVDKSALLDEMIQRQAQLERARQMGLDRDPALRRAYENLLIGALRQRTLTPHLESIQVDDTQVESYYRAHPDDFIEPARVQVALLRRTTPHTLSSAKREALMRAYQQLADAPHQLPPVNEGFGVVAIEQSDYQATRYRGGRLNWWVAGHDTRWPDELEAAAFALSSDGEVSAVIDRGDAIYLLRRIAAQPAERKPLKAVAERIRHKLFIEQNEATRERHIQSILEGMEIERNTALLEALILPEVTNEPIRPRPPTTEMLR